MIALRTATLVAWLTMCACQHPTARTVTTTSRGAFATDLPYLNGIAAGAHGELFVGSVTEGSILGFGPGGSRVLARGNARIASATVLQMRTLGR